MRTHDRDHNTRDRTRVIKKRSMIEIVLIVNRKTNVTTTQLYKLLFNNVTLFN